MDPAARRALVLPQMRHLAPHDPVLREYEHVDLVYELVVSASCFAQLKRHRMATLTPLDYDPALGVTIPESFVGAGLLGRFRELAARSEEVSRRIARIAPAAAAYPLLNAHRRRVLLKLNARELVHLSRLRQDGHAQWDIRRVSGRMVDLGRERMPLALLAAAGKDAFEEMRRTLFPSEE
jgi:thymidylate synthase ThyX